MKKWAVLSFVCLLSGLLVTGCQRDQGVQAGNDPGTTGTYQPRPAPKPQARTRESSDISGELMRVDMAKKTFIVRVENGMEQTFNFNGDTVVVGLEGQPGKTSNTAVRNLAGKEGSEVTVQWRDDNGAKMAMNVNVTQVTVARNTRRGRKGR